MATITIARPRYLGNKQGSSAVGRGGAEHPEVKEKAGQSWIAGDFLWYHADTGTLAIAAHADNITSNAFERLAGQALANATGVTGTPVQYRPVIAGDRFVMNVKGTSTTTNPQTLVGTHAVLNNDGGTPVVNPDGTATALIPVVMIEELYTVANGYPDGDAAGDTYGRVIVRFVNTAGLQG